METVLDPSGLCGTVKVLPIIQVLASVSELRLIAGAVKLFFTPFTVMALSAFSLTLIL